MDRLIDAIENIYDVIAYEDMQALNSLAAHSERIARKLERLNRQNLSQVVVFNLTKGNAMPPVHPKIQEYYDAQAARNARMDKAIDGLVSDVRALKDKIAELQNSSGAFSPEDQALLDQAQQMSESIVAKAEALDNETPAPQAPDVPPVV